MRTDKDRAIEMRLSGKSYREIKAALGTSLATLSLWLKDHEGSKKVLEMLQKKHRGLSREKILKINDARREIQKMNDGQAKREAEMEFKKLKTDPLFVSGISIYWGEGNKVSKYQSLVSNTDPKVILIFRKFLINICKVPESKIKAWLLLYPDLNPEHCKRYWIATTGLNSASFNKSVIIQGRHKNRSLDFGVCNISFGGKWLKIKILVWMELLAKELILE